VTEEELAAIRLHLQLVRDGAEAHVWPWFYRDDVSALLAEVDRLRTELENVDEAIRSNRVLELDYRSEMDAQILRLSAQAAAMRPIVEAVAKVESTYMAGAFYKAGVLVCSLCSNVVMSTDPTEIQWHAPDCPVIQARALLAKEGDDA
jgi:hypothetical protein